MTEFVVGMVIGTVLILLGLRVGVLRWNKR